MKRVFILFLLIFIPHICGAPSIDFRIEMVRFRSITGDIDRKFHESEFTRFIEDLGYRESANNWQSINLIGCFGEWQFDESTLQFLGYKTITLKRFKANPDIFPRELQLKALKTLIRVNLTLLHDYVHFIGDSINGVVISKSGMIAASHLGGAGSLQKFLDSGGVINRKDILGTSISDYLRKFRYYDLK
jgi:hypothetical protein